MGLGVSQAGEEQRQGVCSTGQLQCCRTGSSKDQEKNRLSEM